MAVIPFKTLAAMVLVLILTVSTAMAMATADTSVDAPAPISYVDLPYELMQPQDLGILSPQMIEMQHQVRANNAARFAATGVDPLAENYARFKAFQDTEDATTGPLAPKSVKAICIMINFSDTTTTRTQTYFQNLLFNTSAGVKSMHNYYDEVSYLKVNVNGQAVGWYTGVGTHNWYGGGAYGFGTYPANAQGLCREAVLAADPLVDFSQYDNDGDGEVDALVIVHEGLGAEVTGSTNDIWSHQWSMFPNHVTVDGVICDSYNMQAEFSPMGTFAHEFGHTIGLPDLYDTDYSSSGYGDWCIMGGGSWADGGNTPVQMCAWSKEFMGWLEPTVVSSHNDLTTLDTITTGEHCYKVFAQDPKTNTSEYFLIENRQQVRFDRFLPGAGVLVTHVDNSVWQANPWTCNDDDNHRTADVEEADNNDDPTSSADVYTPTGTGIFSDTMPGANSNALDYTGLTTGISFTNLSQISMNYTMNITEDLTPPWELKLTYPGSGGTHGAMLDFEYTDGDWAEMDVATDGSTVSVHFSPDNSSWVFVNQVYSDEFKPGDDNIVAGWDLPGATYYFRVAVTDQDLNEGYSNVVRFTVDRSMAGIAFDQPVYKDSQLATVTLIDGDLAGTGSTTITVISDTDPAGVSVSMTETPAATGVFSGTLFVKNGTPSAGELEVSDGDIINATYDDASQGLTVFDIAQIRFPPAILNVTHNALEGRTVGEQVIVDTWGMAGREVWFTMPGLTNTQMSEVEPGHYRGSYDVQMGDDGQYTVRALYYDDYWDPAQLDADDPAIIDTEQPSAPRNLTITADPRGNALNLTWDPNFEPNIMGYIIYRSEELLFNYSIINALEPSNFYHDNGLTDGTTYYYRLRAKNMLNKTSSLSDVVWGTPMDIVGPWVNITNPQAYDVLGPTVNITYDREADAELIEFELYKDVNGNGVADDGGPWVYIGSDNTTNDPFLFNISTLSEMPVEGEEYILRAWGTDEVPNMGARSFAINHISWDLTPPAPPVLYAPSVLATDNASFKIEGDTEGNARVVAFVGDDQIGEGKADGLGFFEVDVTLLEGNNLIHVVAFDVRGNGPSDPSNTIDVVLDTTGPVCIITGGNRSVYDYEVVEFDASGTFDENPLPAYNSVTNYTWEFMFNTTLVKYGSRAYQTFPVPGNYTVKLSCRDYFGNPSSITIWVRSLDTIGPTVDAGDHLTVDEDTTVIFDGSGTIDNDPNILSTGNFTWTFYDGPKEVVVYGISFAYVFATPGNFSVQLSVVDSGGNVGYDTVYIEVIDVTDPVVAFAAPTTILEGAEYTFKTDLCTDNDPTFPGSGRFFWTIGPVGSTTGYEGASFTYTFDIVGNNNVNLTVYDKAGNFATMSVVVEVVRDDTPPWVISTYPGHNQHDVELNPVINVTFSEPIFMEAIVDDAISLESSNGKRIPLTQAVASNGGKTLSIRLIENLMEYESYTLSIEPLIKDLAGNRMGGIFNVTFYTKDYPSIKSYTPSAGEINVSVDTSINITFTEPMQQIGVSGFYVRDPSNSLVDVNIQWGLAGAKLILVPVNPLAPSTTYTVEITTEMTDQAGNNLTAGVTFSFTTAAAPETGGGGDGGDGGETELFNTSVCLVFVVVIVVLLVVAIVIVLIVKFVIFKDKAEVVEEWDDDYDDWDDGYDDYDDDYYDDRYDDYDDGYDDYDDDYYDDDYDDDYDDYDDDYDDGYDDYDDDWDDGGEDDWDDGEDDWDDDPIESYDSSDLSSRHSQDGGVNWE